jgi:pimeloyl-ACP methyl ester carboxylesterase
MGKLLTMPRLGETMEQGTVRSWLVKQGTPYKRGDVIAEIETDKTVVEFPALEDGVIERFVANEGDVITVGAALAELAGDGPAPLARTGEGPEVKASSQPEDLAASAPKLSGAIPAAGPLSPVLLPDGKKEGMRPAASPAARKLAKKLGIDLASIPATGRQGRVQGWDVRAALSSHAAIGTADALHYAVRGEGGRKPVVLLHGFGGDKDGWLSLAVPLAQHRKVISIDLPGHGGSTSHPALGLEAIGAAVAATLRSIGIERAHLAGHSMGGGAALALALAAPQLAASLTLFAPAGIGPEINARLLTAYAAATAESEIQIILDQFFGRDARIPKGLAGSIAASRRNPGVVEGLKREAAAMLDGMEQRVLPVDKLAGFSGPIRVIWGEEDRVLPMMPHTRRLPGIVAVHRYRRVGHMPQIEIGRDALSLVQMAIAGE